MKLHSKQRTALGALFSLTMPLVFATQALTAGTTVTLPAGSVDALEDAIAAAGSGGTVILASGLHQETTTVTVNVAVSLVGEPGATLESSAASDESVAPALHITGARGVQVEGISITSSLHPFGDTAILIQEAPRTTIQGNSIAGFRAGTLIQHADHSLISRNHYSDIGRHGIININGRHVRIVGNEILGSELAVPFPFNGIWLCDVGGECLSNTVSGAWFNGILLCRLAGGPIFPDGTEGVAETAATQWVVANNLSFHNDGGYTVSDGANHNLLANNAAYGNGYADIILDGAYDDVPASYENLVTLGSYGGLVIEDIGIDNRVNGEATWLP